MAIQGVKVGPTIRFQSEFPVHRMAGEVLPVSSVPGVGLKPLVPAIAHCADYPREALDAFVAFK